jgi:hypothetical protein
MKITLHRTDPKRYWTAILRDDGASFEIRGIGFMGAAPHDLVHFVVERELGLGNGFWGTVAAGGIFGSMGPVAGRRPFHADAKSAALIKANQDDLNDAELLVGAFTDALDQGLPHLILALGRFTKAGAIKNARVGNDVALRVLDVLQKMQGAFDALPLGGTMTLDWAEPKGRRAKHRA